MYKTDKHRIFVKKWNFFLVVLIFPALSGFGQSRFSNGEITYSIQVESSGNMASNAVAKLEAGKLIFNFKNNLFRSEMHVGNMAYINIYNSNDHTALSLIKGGPGKNYLVRMSREDVGKEAEKYAGMTYTTEPGTTEIAGYTTHKAVEKLADGKTFVVFYTKELQPPSDDYSPRFKNLPGIPLKFEVYTENEVKLVMTATNVAPGFQPSSLFDAPTSGFRELSYEQLQELRNGK